MAKLNSTTIQDVTNKMSLGVGSTTNDKNYFEELYSWIPQLDKRDIFAEIVPTAANSSEADTNVANNPTMISKLTDYQLDELPASNGQGYSCFTIPGNTSSTRLKNFLTPQKYGNGYGFILKDSTSAVIPLTSGSYQFDYQNGIFRFNEGNTPADMGWTTPLTVTAYRYIGTMLVDEVAAASADSWRQPATYIDTTSLIFDNGAAPIVDGFALVDGDTVLFTALTAPADNNRFYIVSGIGTAAVYTLRPDGQNDDGTPTDGDSVLIKSGTVNADNQFKFDGTNWIETGGSFNLTVEEADGTPTGSGINKLVICPYDSDAVFIDNITAYIHAPPPPVAIEIDDTITEWTGRLSQSNINYKGSDPAGTDVTYIARTTDIPTLNTFFSIPTSFSNGSLDTLTLTINGIIVATLDLAANFNEVNRITGQVMADYDITGTGDAVVDGVVTFTNGNLTLNSISSTGPIYADVYQQGSCTVNITNVAGAFRQGYNTISIARGADISSIYEVFYDIDSGANPVVTSSDLSPNVPVLRYISGVPYYDTGSTFNFDVVVDNAFNNVYHSSNAPITVDGFPGVPVADLAYTDVTVTGVSTPPDIAETMTVDDYQFTVIAGQEDDDVQITTIPRDPYGSYITDISASKGISINSVVASSTAVLENFVDENYRFPRTANFNVVPASATGNWTSTTSLTILTNELQVYDEDEVVKACLAHPSIDYSTGRLPIGPDYSGLSGGAGYEYIRIFQGSIDESNGIMDLPGGITDADIAGNNVVIHIKVPTKTDWLNLNNDYNGSTFEDNIKYVSTVWITTNAQVLDDWIIPTTSNGYKYKCTTAGTTGGTEPAVWNTTVGGTTVDGTVVWTTYQIDNDEGCKIDPTVYSPNLNNSLRFTLGTYAADASVSRFIFVRIRYLGNGQSGILEQGFGLSDW